VFVAGHCLTGGDEDLGFRLVSAGKVFVTDLGEWVSGWEALECRGDADVVGITFGASVPLLLWGAESSEVRSSFPECCRSGKGEARVVGVGVGVEGVRGSRSSVNFLR